MALGRARFALNDFSKVLEIKPDFTAAKTQRGLVHMKLGDYENAEIDFYEVVSFDIILTNKFLTKHNLSVNRRPTQRGSKLHLQ